MNEKQVITKLKTLKKAHSSSTLLKTIKQDVDQKIQLQEKKSNSSKGFPLQTYIYFRNSQYFATTLVVIAGVILLLSSITLQNSFHNLVLDTRLTFASNQYQKANLALSDTTSRYGSKHTVGKSDISNISHMLALTNTQMSELKLKGEDGKYTAKQCHLLYQQYLAYLQEEDKATPQSFSNLKSQIKAYKEQAEVKLNMYHNL